MRKLPTADISIHVIRPLLDADPVIILSVIVG